MLIILTGKSGVGKSTIEKYLLKEKGFKRIITYTTRPKRKREKNGSHYFFVDDYNFNSMKEKGNFFETVDRDTIVDNKLVTWHYGSPKEKLNSDKDYIIVLDYDGAEKYIEQYGLSQCFVVNLTLNEKIRKERVERRSTFSEAEWIERCERDNKQFDGRENISNFTLDTFGMSIEDVTFAIISALDEYKKNARGDYRQVKIKRELCHTVYWEQPEVMYIPEYTFIDDKK
jgi:guanylate kinase